MPKFIVEITKKNSYESLMSINEEILSVYFTCLDRGNLEDITNFGIHSNIGKIVFVDRLQFFKIIYEEEKKDVLARIYFFDNTTKILMGSFLISSYNYDDETALSTIELNDHLLTLQNTPSKEYYEFLNFDLEKIVSDIASNNKISVIITDEMYDILTSTIINVSWIKEGTLWSQLTKICEASMARIYCNKNGVITLDSSITKKNNSEIVINPNQILKIENRIDKGKTRIPNASIVYQKIIKKENSYSPTSVPFTWYNIAGTQTDENNGYKFKYSWANYFINVATLRLLVSSDGSYGYYGAGVYTTISIPPHTFRIIEPVVEVNVADKPTYNDNYTITGPCSTDKESDNPSYIPNKLTIEEHIEKENSVYIECEDYNSSNISSNRLVTNGTINFKCDYFVEDGEEIESYSDDATEKDVAHSLSSNELIQKESIFRNSDYRIEVGDTIVDYSFDDSTDPFYINIDSSGEYEVFWSYCIFNEQYAEEEISENMYLSEGEYLVRPIYAGRILIKNKDKIIYDDSPLSTHILKTIKEHYENGIECCEMEVIIDDYYDSNGNIAIDMYGLDTENATFKKHDIVTPYIYKNGIRQPYSIKNDKKTPKSFVVIGTSFSYSGFIRQKLYLQEYTG